MKKRKQREQNVAGAEVKKPTLTTTIIEGKRGSNKTTVKRIHGEIKDVWGQLDTSDGEMMKVEEAENAMLELTEKAKEQMLELGEASVRQCRELKEECLEQVEKMNKDFLDSVEKVRNSTEVMKEVVADEISELRCGIDDVKSKCASYTVIGLGATVACGLFFLNVAGNGLSIRDELIEQLNAQVTSVRKELITVRNDNMLLKSQLGDMLLTQNELMRAFDDAQLVLDDVTESQDIVYAIEKAVLDRHFAKMSQPKAEDSLEEVQSQSEMQTQDDVSLDSKDVIEEAKIAESIKEAIKPPMVEATQEEEEPSRMEPPRMETEQEEIKE